MFSSTTNRVGIVNTMRYRIYPIILGGFIFASFMSNARAVAEILILPAEAAMRDIDYETRGTSRGPRIEQLSPDANESVKSPFAFKLKFIDGGNASIDLTTIRLVYMKSTLFNLTSRVQKYLKQDGIDMPEAVAPAGTHVIRIQFKDTRGRDGEARIEIRVSP